MHFTDFAAAGAHYAARYAEYTAGRLSAQQLEAERLAILVTDPGGARWQLGPSGGWVLVAAAPRRSRRWPWLVAAGVAAFALVGVVGLAGSQDEPPLGNRPGSAATPRVADGLAGVLQAGGVTVYLRHAAREERAETVTDPADCSQQANLTAAGRLQAVRVGAALAALGVRVGEVSASPYCRTRETAELAFGGRPTLVPELAGATLSPPVPAERRAAALRDLLGRTTAKGTIHVVVGHGEVLEEVTGATVAGFAELAVFRPREGHLGNLTFDELVAAACADGRC